MLLNVQMLRALAAFLVVIVHLEPLAVQAGLAPRTLHFGTAGVDLFFVISGLIMVVATAGARPRPLAFLRDRLTRIAPLYWAVTLVVFALAAMAPWAFRETQADPAFLLRSMAFIPYVRPDGFVYPILFVGWSLNYEMAFYLLFALGLALPSRRLGLAATGLVLLAAVAAGAWLQPSDPVLRFYADPMMLEFAGGVVLGSLLPQLRRAPVPAWAAGLVMGLSLLLLISGPALWPHARWWIVPVGSMGAVAAAIVAEARGLAFAGRSIQALGAASYSIYLTHVFCTQVVIMAAAGLNADAATYIGLFILALLLVATVGLFVHRWAEVPLTRIARDWTRSHPSSRPAATADAPA